MHKGTLIARMRLMMEANMASLSANVDSGRRDRAKGVFHYFRKVGRNSTGHAVLEWDTKTEGSGHQYKCYISIEPKGSTLFQLANGAKQLRPAMELIKSADVKCFCTCPDFKFSGAEYNMKHKQDSLEVDHSNRPSADMVPSVRDPEGKHTLCKHLYSCFSGIMTNAATIMKQVRTAKFPPSATQGNTTVIGKSAAEVQPGGQAKTMNSAAAGPADTSTTGKINTLNGGKAIKEDPGEAKAITILGNSAPVNTPEVGEALDAIATTLNSGSDATADTAEPTESGEITMLNGADGDNEPATGSDITLMNGSAHDASGMFGMEDSITSGMFNQAADDNGQNEY